MKIKEIFSILLLLAILIAINYSWMDSKLQGFLIQGNYEFVKINRIIDGDTVKTNETSIRLLGINSPEKKEQYYQEAKDFLNEEVLNKTVKIEYGKDESRGI